MHKLLSGAVVAGCIAWACSAASAQTEAEWKAKVDALEKRLAAVEKAQASAPDANVEASRRTAQEMTADAARYSSEFKIVWDDGVWFKSTDGKFALHVGGRMLADWDWVGARGIERDRPAMGQGINSDTPPNRPNPLTLADGAEMRSLRLLAEGTLFKYVSFKVETDFFQEDDWDVSHGFGGAQGSDMVLRDAYLQLDHIPVAGHFRVGHFKEPFSLEQQTDELFLTFMEPSTMNTLVPGRSFGAMLHDAVLPDAAGVKRMTWAVGVFRNVVIGNAARASEQVFDMGVLHPSQDNTDSNPVRSEEGYSLTARITGLPYYADKGEKLIHVGMSYSYRGANDDQFVRYAVRPEAHNIRYPFLDVSISNVDQVNVLGAEAAVVYGPFSAQAEYVAAMVGNAGRWQAPATTFNEVTNRADNGACFNAFYVQTSYFLTPGDRRAYDTENGAFTRVRPKKNFREDGGWGAVELAGRYSYIDLDEQQLATFGVESDVTATSRGHQTYASRGELHEATLGLNWYLNPNTKVSANYIRSCPVRIDTSSSANIFMMRFQVDF